MFGKNVFSLFSETSPQPQGKPAAQQQQQQPQKPNGTLPSGEASPQLENQQTQQQQNQQQNTSPLDVFKDVWEPNKDDGTGGTPNGETKDAPKPVNYAAHAKKIDFSRLIPQELVQKALAGDASSFLQALNTVSQATLAASMQFSDGHYSRSSKSLEDKITGSLPSRFKELSLSHTPVTNPALKHPAAKPMIEGLKLQLMTKFPDASPQELTAKAEEFFGALMEEMGKKSSNDSHEDVDAAAMARQQQQAGTYDWENFIKPTSAS